MPRVKRFITFCLTLIFFANSSGLPLILFGELLPKPLKDIASTLGPKNVEAEYVYPAVSATVDTGTELTSYTYTGASDNNYWRVLTTSSGLDATLTFNGVTLNSANTILVNFDAFVSNASLTYQVQIRDFTNSTWRNTIAHDTTLANTTEAGAGLLLTSFNGRVYDGYFSNGSNSPVSTPISNFVNGSNQVQIRILSSTTTPNLEMRVDYVSIEPSIENQRTTSSMTNTAGGTITNEYNDTTTDDATTNLVVNANGSGIDAYFSFTGLPTPYTGANTVLVEFSGFRTTITNYTISIRDFTNAQWDTLSATALTNTADATNYFASSTSQAVTDYVSSGEIRIRVSSASTSGSVTVDFVRVTVGSVTTDTGYYVGTISRGGSPTGTVANTETLDTSSADSTWSIPTSTTDTKTTTEYPSDCATATNSCVAANIQMPVTLPSNTLVTGIYNAFRYSISSASIDLEFGIRAQRVGNVNLTPVTDDTASTMYLRTAAFPMPAQTGTDLLSLVPIFQPQDYTNTVDNALNMYVRTAATSVATAQTFTWDFAFVSIRYIDGGMRSITSAWTPTGATLTQGTNNASNYRFTINDVNATANIRWAVTANGTNGTDVYLSFTNVTIPTGANKLIVHWQGQWDVASSTFSLQLWDFVGATWRNINPHGTNFTSSGTANTEQIVQIDVYDGYFSNGSNTPVSTPLSNFVSGGELRLRTLNASTTADLSLDYALVEFSKDPVYFPASMTVTNGTVTGGTEYNDLTTDDATTNLVVSNSGGIDYYFSMLNVVTPPTGSNAVYLTYSGFHTGATNYTVYLRNFSAGGSWEAFNATPLTNTTDAINYFIIGNITDWSNYISAGERRIRVASGAAAGSTTVDFVRLVLGTVNTTGSGSSLDLGGTQINSIAQTRDLDTSVTFNGSTHAWRITSYPNSQSARVYDAPASVAGRVDFPLTVPANSYPLAIIWQWKGASTAGSAMTISPTFINKKNYSSDTLASAAAATAGTACEANMYAPLLGLNALPTASTTTTLATATQTVRDGWYMSNCLATDQTNISDLSNVFDQTNDEITFRFRTSASTSIASARFDFDSIFVALRYVD